MSWQKPQKVWQWLLLLTPSIELMFIPFVADRWGSYIFPHDEIPDVTLELLNLFAALSLSMILGVWQAWHCPNWSDRIATGFTSGIAIAIVNGTIAFAGCASGLIPL